MNIFGLFETRVADALGRLAAAGQIPSGMDISRVVVEPPRDAAHGDLATNAAMVLAKEARMNPRALADLIAADLREDSRLTKVEVAGPGFINLTVALPVFHEVLPGCPVRPRWVRSRRTGRRGSGQCRIRLGEPDRPDARGPRPRRGVRRRAREPAGLRRLQGHPRVLHQRCGRAGRRAGPLRLPALPEALGEDIGADPRRALPRRLPEDRSARRSRRRRPRASSTSPRPSGCRSCASTPSTR